jgi:hypothetical protein
MLLTTAESGFSIMIKDVHFIIPPDYQAGLVTGQYERIGGVIRESQSKKIVAWLREVSTATDKPLQQLGIKALSAVTKFSGVISLGLAAATMLSIHQSLDAFSKQIQGLKALISKEFSHDREAEFRAALEVVEGVYTAQDETTKRQLAANAVASLLKCVESFSKLTEDYISTAPMVAQVCFVQAINASLACVQCNLEINEYNTARNYLRKHLTRFNSLSRQLIEKLLGKYPAIYFHADVPREGLERFVVVQNWLQPRNLIDILDEFRSDFWKEEVLKNTRVDTRNPVSRFSRPSSKKVDDLSDVLLSNLAQAELIIENFQRMQSIEMEIRFLRLTQQSFSDWNNILNDYQSELNVATDVSFAVLELDNPILLADD